MRTFVERKKTAFLHAHAVQLLLWMWYPADYNEAVKLQIIPEYAILKSQRQTLFRTALPHQDGVRQMPGYTADTISYYEKNAEKFIRDTASADMRSVREAFLAYIPEEGRILDLGCGSGRDSRAFLDAGYRVTSLDGSPALCRAAQLLTGQEVICSLFQEYRPEGLYDGIWACASLLHLSGEDLLYTVRKYAGALRSGGCFYMSFKKGDFSGERNGRFFTDLTKESLSDLLSQVNDLKTDSLFLTGDVRPGRVSEEWINVFAIKEEKE